MNSSILLQVFLLAVFVPLIYSYWNVHRAQHTEPKILYKKPLKSIWKKQQIPPQQAIDWSDPDMMQKPIDDIPRRVSESDIRGRHIHVYITYETFQTYHHNDLPPSHFFIVYY